MNIRLVYDHRMRATTILLGLLFGCGGHGSTRADDASTTGSCDGGCAKAGEVCGSSPVDLDAGARPCEPGLVCCYPCGIPDCADRCTQPCTPGPGCQAGGCPGPFP
jgi:hypothetical protein